MEATMICIQKNDSGLKPLNQIFGEYFRTGDKNGTVSYGALPPLSRSIIDAMAKFGFDYKKKRVHRFLLDFSNDPKLRELSTLLWKLYRLEINVVPIMGTKEFGKKNKQESWEIYIAKEPNALIQLGYQGISLDEILKTQLLGSIRQDSTVQEIISVYKEVLQYLPNYLSVQQNLLLEIQYRLTNSLLYQKNLEIYLQLTELLNYYRASKAGIPPHFSQFILQSYKIYCQEIPDAFATEDIFLSSLVGILTFIKHFESIVIAQGGTRDEFDIALNLVDEETLAPEKYAIYLVAQSTLNHQILNRLRQIFYETYSNPLTLHRMPRIVEGLLYATYLSKMVTPLIGELLDQAFRRMEDNMLVKWILQLMEVLSDVDKSVTTQLKQVIYATYTADTVDLWYNLESYETGRFVTTQQKKVKNPTTHEKPAKIIQRKLTTAFTRSVREMTQLLGLKYTEQGKGNSIPETLVVKFPTSHQQLAKLLGIPLSVESYKKKSNLGGLFPNAMKQAEKIIGGN